jgi:hypothetical protein
MRLTRLAVFGILRSDELKVVITDEGGLSILLSGNELSTIFRLIGQRLVNRNLSLIVEDLKVFYRICAIALRKSSLVIFS